MIRYVDWISIPQLENITWPAQLTKYIDIGVHFSSNTKIRYKCYYEGYTNHTGAIGCPNSHNPDFAVFWYPAPNNIYCDIANQNINTTMPKEAGDFIDFTVVNRSIYDNVTESYILSGNPVSAFENNVDTILIDVQTARFKAIEIYENNVLVFNGKAAYDTVSGNIGVYDSIGGNLIVNQDLTLSKGADLSSLTVTPSATKIDSTEQMISFEISTETDWSASTSASYVTFVSGITSGTSADSATTIVVEANTGSTAREFTVVFENAEDTIEVTIKQNIAIQKYVFCDWIEADALLGTSFIDTGIYPSMDTEIEATVMNMKNDASLANRPIIGNNESKGMSLRDRLQLYLMGNFGDVEEIGWYQELSMPYMEKRHILFNSNELTVTGDGGYSASKNYTATTMTGTSTTIHINGYSGVNSTNSYRYGEVIIRKNGTVVWDGLPCIYGNQVGMYDLVSSEFFAGQGDRPFVGVDKSGYVTFGVDDFETLMIGEEKVKRVYIGEKLFYVEGKFNGLQISATATLGNASGSTANLKIKSSEPWTLSIDQSATWVSASTISGYAGETTVVLTATQDNSGSEKTTTITATSSSFSATCEVEQAAIHYVKSIYTQSMNWDSSKYIDTQVTATTATTMRIGYIGADIGSDRVIGYDWMDFSDGAYNQGWRYFNGFGNTNTVDLLDSRKQGGSPTRQSEVEYDITLGNNYLYDNINGIYIIAQSNEKSALTRPHSILVDVGSQKVKFVEIYDGQTKVFDGKAAVDDANNIIGLYDSVSNTWKYNSALTMSYEVINV